MNKARTSHHDTHTTVWCVVGYVLKVTQALSNGYMYRTERDK